MSVLRRPLGFTIAEVLIAVALIGVLATIAVPQYGIYVKRSRILDAFAKLSDYRTRMEQYFLDHRSYVDDGGLCGVRPATVTAGDSFEVACTGSTRAFVYTATGVATKGMERFVYTIDETGLRATLSLPNGWLRTADCWTIRADGSCA